ncbi:PREDICTED: uncharacterized protein LOC108368325 [Rhagoletis zephyria]|uniref:uncharacterized protein LOC108368325 n=1 Tax=Rhagoletis zephyria TaxID=28612 RepID=UPI00081176AF|nr:PREDICTED: uncharacterized protein LOC108368325 [Rhagoletis zephyria]
MVCPEFKALSVHNRWKLVKANRVCLGCLQRGHGLSECQSRRECGLDECKRMHRTLLHQPPNSTKPPSTTHSATSPPSTNNEHLLKCRDTSYSAIKPLLLIGLDNSQLSATKEMVCSGPNEPIAVITKLGWVAYGLTHTRGCSTSNILHIRNQFTTQQLHQLVQEYFSLDSFAVQKPNIPLESVEDLRARKILEKTTKNIGHRYEVGLLWCEDNVELPQSYEMAKRRLINVENKIAKDPVYAKNYIAEINKYVERGYAQLLSAEESSQQGPSSWYLPHFGVINPHKPAKLRIVFDAAASVSNISLNYVLMKGPERAQSLMVIMVKFRQRPIAIAGDIQEMFSQVKIRAEDRQSQRFLWRHGDQLQPIQVYVMTSMIFGAACSPCCAEYIKNLNANRFKEEMPRGVKAVIENTYVDDLVASYDSSQEASEVVNEAITINAAAGFHLRNFVSNCKELQRQLNRGTPRTPDIINMERQPKTDKVLGMYWNFSDDVLEFHFKFHKIPRDVLDCKRLPTKRELLGLPMAIYDPFGLLANVTVAVKLILQETWKQQVDWDDPLLTNLRSQWLMSCNYISLLTRAKPHMPQWLTCV